LGGILQPGIEKRPLHHDPTCGGAKERAKFAGWYAKTLESYRYFFEEEPPADIWPPLEKRFGKQSRFARVDIARKWIIPKFSPDHLRMDLVILGALCMAAAGCASVLATNLNPFDLRGWANRLLMT